MSDYIICPHCQIINNMEGEALGGHVTVWGDDDAKPFTCDSCSRELWVQEHVIRWWSAGATQEEASDV